MFATNTEVFCGSDSDECALAVRAFVWGYPLVRSAQLRANTTRSSDGTDAMQVPEAATAPLNRMGHARLLATPQTRIGVAPNHDTLYSLAWLDTRASAFVLETPDFGSRYYTFQMGQGDSSTDISLGQRTHGARLPPVFIHGPHYRGRSPKNHVPVRSRHRYLMIAGRILVNGAEDLPAVHSLQDQISLRPWHPARPLAAAGGPQAMPLASAQQPPGIAGELDFLAQLGSVLGDFSLSERELRMLDSFRRIGLSVKDGFQSQTLTAQQQEMVAAGLRTGEASVRRKTGELGRQVNGWSINDRGSRFGEDFLLRAAVAMDQIYIVEPEEAIYPSARVDSQGETLDGCHDYRIRFGPTDMPPVGAFWSITLYFAQGFMVPNPIDRWSIGDRTPGLVRDPDGALEILVQHAPPDAAVHPNWLPAPKAPFMLLMRLYHPQAAILDGSWVPPPIERIVRA
jgi:hypothetical protein